MDNYQGDLTDILRASGGALGQSTADVPVSTWEFSSDPMNLSSMGGAGDDRDSTASVGVNIFGDPFCNMRDPLLHELNVAGCSYFCSQNSPADHHLLSSATTTCSDHDHHYSGGGGGASNFVGANSSSNVLAAHHQKVFEGPDHQMENTSSSSTSIFSRIQISPNNPTKLPVSPCNSPAMAAAAAASSGSSPRGSFKAATSSAVVSSDRHIINVDNLIDNTVAVQISSPRNLGIKRRKSQAKKVVCIPAPAAASSRPSSGEVVPSDLWAWRKYGQKPIKGSPYPRGYYRCSSSKGCSARKQVERSRTDPNMLVITYTSEHNHPWPTQRNALAGSTRSQPPRTSTTSSASKRSSTANEEQKESSSSDTLSPSIDLLPAASNISTAAIAASVKEEIDEKQLQHEMDMDDSTDQFSEGFSQSYRPSMPAESTSDQDFFAELGEIDGDPLDLLFTQGFNGDIDDHDQRKGLSKGGVLDDPFSIFDWSSADHHHTNSSSFGDQTTKRSGLN